MGRSPATLAVIAIVVLAGVVSGIHSIAHAASSAKGSPTEDRRTLCFLDGKAYSLGAAVVIEGKSYRCTATLAERGSSELAWVQVRMASVIVE